MEIELSRIFILFFDFIVVDDWEGVMIINFCKLNFNREIKGFCKIRNEFILYVLKLIRK